MDNNEFSVLKSSLERSIQGIGVHQYSRSLNLMIVENYSLMTVDIVSY